MIVQPWVLSEIALRQRDEELAAAARRPRPTPPSRRSRRLTARRPVRVRVGSALIDLGVRLAMPSSPTGL